MRERIVHLRIEVIHIGPAGSDSSDSPGAFGCTDGKTMIPTGTGNAAVLEFRLDGGTSRPLSSL